MDSVGEATVLRYHGRTEAQASGRRGDVRRSQEEVACVTMARAALKNVHPG